MHQHVIRRDACLSTVEALGPQQSPSGSGDVGALCHFVIAFVQEWVKKNHKKKGNAKISRIYQSNRTRREIDQMRYTNRPICSQQSKINDPTKHTRSHRKTVLYNTMYNAPMQQVFKTRSLRDTQGGIYIYISRSQDVPPPMLIKPSFVKHRYSAVSHLLNMTCVLTFFAGGP